MVVGVDERRIMDADKRAGRCRQRHPVLPSFLRGEHSGESDCATDCPGCQCRAPSGRRHLAFCDVGNIGEGTGEGLDRPALLLAGDNGWDRHLVIGTRSRRVRSANLQDPVAHPLLQLDKPRRGAGEVVLLFGVGSQVVDCKGCLMVLDIESHAFVAIEEHDLHLATFPVAFGRIKVLIAWGPAGVDVLDIDLAIPLLPGSGQAGEQ